MSGFVDYTLTQDVANGSTSTGSTTMLIAYPASVTAGQVLVVFAMWTRTGGGVVSATLSGSGWATDGAVGFAATYAVQSWYKVAAGTETGNETLSHSVSTNRHFHDAFMLRYNLNNGLDLTEYLLDTDLQTGTANKTITLDEDGIGFDMDEADTRLVIGLHLITHPDAFPITSIVQTNSTPRFDVADSATGTATAYRYLAEDHIYAPTEAALDIVSTLTTTPGTSGFNTISLFLGLAFTDAVEDVRVPSARLELPQTRLHITVFPNKLTQATLDGFD